MSIVSKENMSGEWVKHLTTESLNNIRYLSEYVTNIFYTSGILLIPIYLFFDKFIQLYSKLLNKLEENVILLERTVELLKRVKGVFKGSKNEK